MAITCPLYVPPVRTACTDCPDPSEVVSHPKDAASKVLIEALDANAEIIRCLTDHCLGNRDSEELTTAAPAAALFGNSNIDSTAAAVDATLADGTYVGQEKYFLMTEASNSSTVTVANHETSVPEVFTFDALDESLMLKWTGAVWSTIGTATATV